MIFLKYKKKKNHSIFYCSSSSRTSSLFTVTHRQRWNSDIFRISTCVCVCVCVRVCNNAFGGVFFVCSVHLFVRTFRFGTHLSAERQRRSPLGFSATVASLGRRALGLEMCRAQREAGEGSRLPAGVRLHARPPHATHRSATAALPFQGETSSSI